MAENVQNLRQPPFYHSGQTQKGPSIYQTGDDTPGDSQKSIERFVREVTLTHNGTWRVDLNLNPFSDFDSSTVIERGYYDPDFRVRYFKLHNADNLFAAMVYDLPWSTRVVSLWSCGVLIKGQLTRIWTGDDEMSKGTADVPFRISLLG